MTLKEDWEHFVLNHSGTLTKREVHNMKMAFYAGASSVCFVVQELDNEIKEKVNSLLEIIK